ncbi:MAG: hypothetical protein ACRERV_10235, partial [Methylococcales bacterium]
MRIPRQSFGSAFEAVAGDRRVAVPRCWFVEQVALASAANRDPAKGFPGLGCLLCTVSAISASRHWTQATSAISAISAFTAVSRSAPRRQS